jgi:hypothetical protein
MIKAVVGDLEREKKTREIFGLLEGDQGRSGPDSMTPDGIYFQHKSTSTSSYCTSRTFGLPVLRDWVNQHWIFCHFTNYETGFEFDEFIYVSPTAFRPTLIDLARKAKERLLVCDEAVELYSRVPEADPKKIKQLKSMLARGAKIDNHHFSDKLIREIGVPLEPNPKSLKAAMKKAGSHKPIDLDRVIEYNDPDKSNSTLEAFL